MNRRGFTIIELVIVITILGILLILAVVNLSGTQVNARDSERKSDIEAIALNIETFYTSGTDGSATTGRYPSLAIIGQEQTLLRDIDPKSLAAPGATSSSLIPALNNLQTTIDIDPQPSVSEYVYQPLQSDGSLCTTEAQECRKFNLYYGLEGDETVYLVSSKNQ
ncbi:prepilin-type N-terminal cleavage/methylation domain-containing protein [Candidatus Saccharibacteria bacterium]|nr:prepilin-type N-terminal cleavage/methylation domain-containing protein [Candidatus Saccharibacteria bacterium]